MVQKLMQKSQKLTSRKIKVIYALDSANQKPKTAFKFISFSQKGLHPPPPHYCSFESDFLHHEAGEFLVLSHE